MSDKNPFYGETFAERKALRKAAEKPVVKQVDDETGAVEDKAMKPAQTKRPARKKS